MVNGEILIHKTVKICDRQEKEISHYIGRKFYMSDAEATKSEKKKKTGAKKTSKSAAKSEIGRAHV